MVIRMQKVLQDYKALSREQKQAVRAAVRCWLFDELMPDEIDNESMVVAECLLLGCSTSEALKIIEEGLGNEE